jgi:predicted ATPase/DNA-binding winged helix-turn-helix (wHTH) protein
LAHSCYRFDRFELRPTERLLYLEGEPTSLGARAVDVLTVMVEANGRLVSKLELLDRVWPGLVVEENNLQVQISSIRKLLGAKAIATVPGRGYRFCLPVVGDQGQPVQHLAVPSASAPTASDVLSVLPAMPGRLWGREADLAELEAQLPAPLITVVGQAGIGKTAFALGVAHAWRSSRRDGAAWVELAGIADPQLVVSLVAQSLGLSSGGHDPLQTLVSALKPLQVLLVIDNAEHVLDAVARLAQAVMQGAPDVRMVVTSQLPLRVPGERVFRLGPLSVPPEGATVDEAIQHGAVALFIDQVQAANRHFELDASQVARVINLCRRLDGVALAIKLAAARVPVLGLQGVEERLGERFKLLHTNSAVAPSRQQTLLAALDWSHELLTPPERTVFRRLAVLAGGFTLDLAKALAHDHDLDEWAVIDVLSSLVDRSLVMADAGESPRYRLLDSMRDYAGLKLVESGELPDIRKRHAQALAATMDAAYEDYWAQSDAQWLGKYGNEIDNVRMAMDWSVQNDKTLAIRLLGASGPLFLLLGLAPECRQRGLPLVDVATSMQSGAEVARFWLERSRLHWGVGNSAMHDLALSAASSYRAAGDRRGLYLALRCLAGSGVMPGAQALAVLDEMAALESPDWPARLQAQRLQAEVSVLRSIEYMAEARRVCQNLLVRAQAGGLDGVVSATLSDLASISLSLGDTETAMQTCQQLLDRGRHRRDNFILHALAIVACVSFVKGDLVGARAALTDFVSASRSRDWEWLGLYAGLLALLAALEGRHEAAARLLGYTSRAYEQLGSRDVLTVYAWSRASGLVQDAVDSTVLPRLKEMGATMDPESVCTWALSSPPG